MHVDFKRIKIQNFLSVGTTPIEINFQSGIHFITGYNKDEESRNGVGKTTIVSALFFALYGELDRKMLKSAIAHRFNDETCIVELEYSVGENNYKIIRTLRPNKVFFFINEEDKTKTSDAVNADIIKSIGNTGQDLFEKTIVMSSNSTTPFLAMPKKADKIEFIEGILSLNYFSEMLDRARKKYNANDKLLTAENSKFATLNSQMQGHKNSYKQFETSRNDDIQTIAEEKIRIQNNIDELTKQININSTELTTTKNSLQASIKVHEKETDEYISGLEEKIQIEKDGLAALDQNLASKVLAEEDKKTVFRDKLEKISEKETLARGIEKKLDTERAENNAELTRIKREIQKLDNTPTTCPTCKQPLKDCDPKHILDAKNELEKEQKNIQDKNSELDKKYADFNEKWTKLQTLKTTTNDEIKNIDRQITVIKNEMATTKSNHITAINAFEETIQKNRQRLKQKNSEIVSEIEQIEKVISGVIIKEQNIEKLKTTLDSKDGEIDKIRKKENPFKAVIISAKEDIAACEKQVHELELTADVLNQIKFIVSPEGLKAFIIKKIIKLFNQRLDYYLKRLHSKYFCTFDEYFEERIFDQKEDIGYTNLSGGERKRLDLAMLFTFRDIRKHQTGITFNLSVYDEIFDSAICSFGMDQVIGILQDQVTNNNESFYIVTHRKENCDYNNIKVIELVKENNCTTLVA